jgi:hypothetical protein
MVFDFLVTVLAVIKLWAWRKQGGLSQLTLENGIGYFIFASCGNLVQAVLAALNLSSLLNVLFLPVAMCISVIGMSPDYEFGVFKLTGWLILASTRVFVQFPGHADPHNTYTPQTGKNHPSGTVLAPNHYQSSLLGQQPHLPPMNISATPYTNMSPLAPGIDQSYALDNSKV